MKLTFAFVATEKKIVKDLVSWKVNGKQQNIVEVYFTKSHNSLQRFEHTNISGSAF